MATKRRKGMPRPEASNAGDEDNPTSSESTRGSMIGMRKRKKGRWWQCGPVKVLILAVLGMFVLNYASLKREQRSLMPPGELKDIGWGQKLFIRCTGSGEPVVVLDTPTGDTSDIWVFVEPLLSKFTKVCVYDRAGLGFSDRAYRNTSRYANDFGEEARYRDRLTPGTVERMADDLYRLLHQTVGNASVVLVGVDFSALVSRFYAQLYENQVKGLFLIDPMVETLFDNNSTWAYHWYEEAVPHINMLYLGGTIGINRIALMLGAMKPIDDSKVLRKVPMDLVNRKKYLLCSSVHLSALIDEVFLVNESMNQVKTMFKVKPFPRHLPITMATFEQNTKGSENNLTTLWRESQTILTSMIHPSAKHVVLPGQDHNMLYLNPKPVVSAIVDFVKQLKRTSVK